MRGRTAQKRAAAVITGDAVSKDGIPRGYECLKNLPLRVIAHLTTPRPRTSVEMEGLFAAWIRTLQEHHGFTIGWIRADERRPQLHIHAILVAGRTISCIFAAEAWRQLVSRRSKRCALVEPYDPTRGGLAYVLKTIDDRAPGANQPRGRDAYQPNGEVTFSPNLEQFGIDRYHRKATARERRQLRRIRKQMGSIG